MLQRQSNALAGREAALIEQLSDQKAFANALQEERSRLEKELMKAHGDHAVLLGGRAAAGMTRRSEEGGSDGGGGGGSISGEQGAAAAAPHAPTESTQPPLSTTNTETVDFDISDDGNVIAAAEEAIAEASAAAEAKASTAVAAAEARSRALSEMVGNLVSEKVAWEEERAAHAAEAMRLRAHVRGLQESVATASSSSESGTRKNENGQGPSAALRELLRQRTRELEGKHSAMERLGKAWEFSRSLFALSHPCSRIFGISWYATALIESVGGHPGPKEGLRLAST